MQIIKGTIVSSKKRDINDTYLGPYQGYVAFLIQDGDKVFWIFDDTLHEDMEDYRDFFKAEAPK